MDPISDRFAWVSTYNYAENRVPNGIDLHGLQFLQSHHLWKNNPEMAKRNAQMHQQSRVVGGEVALGFTPVGVALDIRDAGIAIRDRDAVGFGLAMIGFLPGGDIFKGRKILNDARKSVDEVEEFGGGISNIFSDAELGVIEDARSILDSGDFQKLREAAEKGEFAEISVGGLNIKLEPDFMSDPSTRAMTFGDDFILNPLTITQQPHEELVKTILHELHRLNFSEVVKKQSINPNSASTTTREAYEFAEEAAKVITGN